MPNNGKSQLELPADVNVLPKGWNYKLLNSLVDISRGISYGVVQPGSSNSVGVPIVRVNNLKQGRIITDDIRQVPLEIASKYDRTKLRGGELLLSLVGTLGECAIVPKNLAGWNVARAVGVIPVLPDIGSQWVYYCLKTPQTRHYISTWATTTVQATLNLRDVAKLPIPLPPKSEREGIVRILSSLDDKIELNQQMNLTLETQARAIFKSWFIDFDPVRAKMEGRQPVGMDAATAALFPDWFEESPLGMIPMGWKVKPLPEIIEINPNRSLSKGQIAPYLDMKSMPTQGHRPNEWINRALQSGTKFINGDTLIAKITPCLENGKTAFVDFLEDGQVGWGSTEYLIFRPKSPLPAEFGYHLARSEEFRAYAIQNMTGSSGRQRTPVECFWKYLISVPEKPIVEKFGELIKPLMAKIAANSNQSRNLSTIRDILLPKLMSGEIRVKQAEKIVREAA